MKERKVKAHIQPNRKNNGICIDTNENEKNKRLRKDER